VRDASTKQALAELYLPPWKAYFNAIATGDVNVGALPRSVTDADYFAEHLAEVPAIVVVVVSGGLPESLQAAPLIRAIAALTGDPPLIACSPFGAELVRTIDGAGEVVAVDAAAYFSRPGPRVVDGLELLAHILHPERIPEAPGVGLTVEL